MSIDELEEAIARNKKERRTWIYVCLICVIPVIMLFAMDMKSGTFPNSSLSTIIPETVLGLFVGVGIGRIFITSSYIKFYREEIKRRRNDWKD